MSIIGMYTNSNKRFYPKRLSIFLGLLFAANIIVAQTNYYTESKIFKENGYTYKADVATFVELYNAENKLTHEEPKYRNTGDFYDPENSEINLYFDSTWVRAEYIFDSIMRTEFSAVEMERIKKATNKFTINLFVNSENGTIDEIGFSFYKKSVYGTIPVSTYRRIEQEIKEKVHLSISNEFKQLTFIYYWMKLSFK